MLNASYDNSSVLDLDEQAFAEAVSRPGIVFVDWWAPWCGPCKMFAPIYEKVAGAHPDVTWGKINTDEQVALAQAFGIMSIPTLMIFRDGILLFAQAGVLPQAGLEEILRRVEELDMDEVREQLAAARAARDAGAPMA